QIVVRPLVEELIAQVQDPKLSSLLREFNSQREVAPNLAAIAFRTILSLVIKQRATKVQPQSRLATSGDINFEQDIRDALMAQPPIFDSGELKLLKRYQTGGKKDAMDNVTHKITSITLVTKDDLEDGVDLLNSLLPTIV